MSDAQRVIGTYHQPAETIRHCPSYYAADHETLSLAAGDYPARVTIQGGYNYPMPYWLLIAVDATRVEGRLYSGFGGNNFASTELTSGERVKYSHQWRASDISEMVDKGLLTLSPGYAWMYQPAQPDDKGADRYGRFLAATKAERPTWDAWSTTVAQEAK